MHAVEDVLLWRDPKKSGIALGGITVVYLLISHISYNPVVVLANIAQFAVISCFLYNLVTNFLKRRVQARMGQRVQQAQGPLFRLWCISLLAARACLAGTELDARPTHLPAGRACRCPASSPTASASRRPRTWPHALPCT